MSHRGFYYIFFFQFKFIFALSKKSSLKKKKKNSCIEMFARSGDRKKHSCQTSRTQVLVPITLASQRRGNRLGNVDRESLRERQNPRESKEIQK
jgi:hypothetical protein